MMWKKAEETVCTILQKDWKMVIKTYEMKENRIYRSKDDPRFNATLQRNDCDLVQNNKADWS